MVQYVSVNVIWPKSQFNKSKLRTKTGTEVSVNLLSKEIGNPNDWTNFPHKLILTDAQVWRLEKGFGK